MKKSYGQPLKFPENPDPDLLQHAYPAKIDQISIEVTAQSTDQEEAPAPLPEGGLPPGWTDEQWAWYGHEYLAGTYGGGQQ